MVREVGDAVSDVATWDVPPGGCGEDSAEYFFTGTTGGRKFLPRESFLYLPAEGIPIGLTEVGESAMRGFWEVH